MWLNNANILGGFPWGEGGREGVRGAMEARRPVLYYVLSSIWHVRLRYMFISICCFIVHVYASKHGAARRDDRRNRLHGATIGDEG